MGRGSGVRCSRYSTAERKAVPRASRDSQDAPSHPARSRYDAGSVVSLCASALSPGCASTRRNRAVLSACRCGLAQSSRQVTSSRHVKSSCQFTPLVTFTATPLSVDARWSRHQRKYRHIIAIIHRHGNDRRDARHSSDRSFSPHKSVKTARHAVGRRILPATGLSSPTAALSRGQGRFLSGHGLARGNESCRSS